MKRRIIGLVLLLVLLLPCCSLAESAHELAYRQAEACAFSAEYGDDRDCVVKWTDEIRVWFTGNYSAEDLSFFYDFTKQLAERVPGLPPVVLVNSREDSNVEVYFIRLSEMSSVLSGYVEGNWGFFTYWYDNYAIDDVQIGIAWDVCDSRARNHLMMEEFIGALGLSNDHWLDAESILYQQWTTVQKLTDADWNMLRMLYDSRVTPGIGRQEALRIMRGVY